ncbi:hypothetical protein E8E11_005800, partial [Didymella keratinophila]
VDAEYALLTYAKSVSKVYKAKAQRLEKMEGFMIPKPAGGMFGDMLIPGAFGFHMQSYYGFQLTGCDVGLEGMLSKTEPENVPLELFMKFAIPTHRHVFAFDLIYSPMNMTTFFRFASGWVDLSPFMPGLRSLTALWLNQLPFGITSPIQAPPAARVQRYRITFDKEQLKWQGDTKTPVFTLIFCRETVMPLLIQPHKDIRSTLLPDESTIEAHRALAFRKNSALIGTWEWKHNEMSATFWLNEATIQKLEDEDGYGKISDRIFGQCVLYLSPYGISWSILIVV